MKPYRPNFWLSAVQGIMVALIVLGVERVGWQRPIWVDVVTVLLTWLMVRAIIHLETLR